MKPSEKPNSSLRRRAAPAARQISAVLLAASLLLALLAGCTLPAPANPPQATQPPAQGEQPAQPVRVGVEAPPEVQVTFRVRIPENTPYDQAVLINILDEVGGLDLHPETYEMVQEDPQHYILQLSFPLGSLVKYRYSRQTEAAPVNEYTSAGRQTRYRLYAVQGPGLVDDVISRWTDTQFFGPAGRIMGSATDTQTGEPVPGLLVTAGGAQAFSAADGTFIIEGLPPGTHNLVAYAPDGAYRTFQQGALVADQSTTQAPLMMEPSRLVNITFEVKMPAGTIPGVPIRIAGSLHQFGNTFADLAAGLSTQAGRMPALQPAGEGLYRLTMALPAGADLRYLYTLGDGFWNAEITANGEFQLRRVIIPQVDSVIQDTVEAWTAPGAKPLVFDITVPPDTWPGDRISIQFNPLIGWSEPIPMWPLGGNRWVYVLNHPLDVQGSLRFRVCRNEQCGAADDASSAGPSAAGLPATPAGEENKVSYQVPSWAWYSSTNPAWTSSNQPVPARGADFVAGVEFNPQYQTSWSPYMNGALEGVQAMRANWLVIDPTWSYPPMTLPILEQTPGKDALWHDLAPVMLAARQRGLQVAVFPSVNFPAPPEQWWSSSQRDFPWWVVWFEQYRKFALHHAELAARTGAGALVLGGDWLLPALPGALLGDGLPSGVPADADARWRGLIAEVRQAYNGRLAWAMSYERITNGAPAFLDAVDQIYLLFDEPLAQDTLADPQSMFSQATMLLDVVEAFYQRVQKPILLAAAYGSWDGAATSCAQDGQGGCLAQQDVLQPGATLNGLPLDLQEQAQIYETLLAVSSNRPWITGFISRGFYPPAMLQDLSPSVNGKPAQAALAYWFANLVIPPP